MMDNWIDGIIKDGIKLIQESNTIFNDAEALLGEVQTWLTSWETDEAKWDTIVILVSDSRFSIENPLDIGDVAMLYIVKKT